MLGTKAWVMARAPTKTRATTPRAMVDVMEEEEEEEGVEATATIGEGGSS